jgi:hypothetical protein
MSILNNVWFYRYCESHPSYYHDSESIQIYRKYHSLKFEDYIPSPEPESKKEDQTTFMFEAKNLVVD